MNKHYLNIEQESAHYIKHDFNGTILGCLNFSIDWTILAGKNVQAMEQKKYWLLR